MNILVSNLNRLTTAEHLLNLFVPFGLVKLVRKDNNGQSQALGFVKMEQRGGHSAINGLNEIKFMNFYIQVSEAPM
jgi:RNA recognition motif-containing protein